MLAQFGHNVHLEGVEAGVEAVGADEGWIAEERDEKAAFTIFVGFKGVVRKQHGANCDEEGFFSSSYSGGEFGELDEVTGDALVFEVEVGLGVEDFAEDGDGFVAFESENLSKFCAAAFELDDSIVRLSCTPLSKGLLNFKTKEAVSIDAVESFCAL